MIRALHDALAGYRAPTAGPAEPNGGYDDLPDSIKGVVSPVEYAWMTETQRASLVQRETEPEWDE